MTVSAAGESPSGLRDIWVHQLGDHIRCQLELYVMVAIRWRLTQLLSGRRVIWWVDNDAARFALIKGQSLSQSMNLLVRIFLMQTLLILHLGGLKGFQAIAT